MSGGFRLLAAALWIELRVRWVPRRKQQGEREDSGENAEAHSI